MNILKLELRYKPTTPFRNARATNEGNYAEFATFDLKLVAMATDFMIKIGEIGRFTHFHSLSWHFQTK